MGDSGVAETEMANIPRKRSEEMRYWRESLQGGVLRASGFRMPSVGGGVAEQEREEVGAADWGNQWHADVFAASRAAPRSAHDPAEMVAGSEWRYCRRSRFAAQ